MHDRDQTHISRRKLLGGAAAAAGAVAVSGAPGAADAAAARAPLDRARVPSSRRGRRRRRPVRAERGAPDPSAGHSVIVLEARDRVGGRTFNHDSIPDPGKVVEVGGQWIGPTQDHIARLARDLGVKTFDTYNKGNYLFYENGKLTPYDGGPVRSPRTSPPTSMVKGS